MNQHQNQAKAQLELMSEKDFRDGVMPRAQLSKLACEIALKKSTNGNVKEFAGWELQEATTVIDVLEDLDTPQVTLSEESASFINRLKNLNGSDFDKTYMDAELSNHEFLRDLAQGYLGNPDGKPSGRDKETWHVASLALFAFTEHVGLCKKIIAEIAA